MSPKHKAIVAAATVIGSILTVFLIVLQIINTGIDIRIKTAVPAPPITASQPAPQQQDIKTGSIPKKSAGKLKSAPEPPATLIDWIKRQFEAVPLRDQYTRD